MGPRRPESPAPGRPPLPLVLVGLLVLLVASVLLAAATGSVAIPLWDAWTTLLSTFLPVESTASSTHASILRDIRLPRIALAATTGATLALAGLLLAGALRNPLAEPVTTGTAAGALLGTSLAAFLLPLVLGGNWSITQHGTTSAAGHIVRILLAAGFAFGATLLVWTTARTSGTILAGPLLLSGLAVNALVGAAAALVLFIAPVGAVTGATLVVQWIFGGLLAEAGPGSATPVLIVLVAALAVTIPLLRPLDLLLAGEVQAAATGLGVARVRAASLGAASLATGAAVALAGVIAFIGLIAPTLVRPLTGVNHSRLLPAALLMGAALLVFADAIGRRLAAPAEVPVGVITALFGAPVLLVLLVRTLREVTR